MDLMSHLGTHCECPYHHDDSWADVADLPLTSFIGRGIYISLDDAAPNSHITAQMLDIDRMSGKSLDRPELKRMLNYVREGDVVILDSKYKLPPFTAATNTEADQRLFVNGETAQWMVEHKVKCIGFGDGVSIENCNEDVKPFHDVCMAENITFLEVLCNLEELRQDTFFLSFAPLYIKGLDSCPVRVYAIEGLDGFC